MMFSRKKRKQALAVASCLALGVGSGWGQGARPEITGISHMSVYTSDPSGAEHFYGVILGAPKGPDPQSAQGERFYLSPTQFVEVLPLPAEHTINRVEGVSYETVNAEGLRKYIVAHGVTTVGELQTGSDGSHWFETKDPEGNDVEFFEHGKLFAMPASAKPIGTRIIHVGFLVHNKDAEDKFYKGVLGFRPYWFGAMKPDHVDWVSQQVPNGHDWLEYMMVGDGSDSPIASINQNHLGVLNHFSIGVANMEKAITVLNVEDRLSPKHDGPQMGKDGKWQGNLYDPDGTRVELMEFQPVMEPCCSQFTAESPTH